MLHPKVTIITCCFNSEKTIETTIQSVLNQDYGNIEYIIKDAGSTDGTMQIVNRYSDKISKIISCPDKGIYHAINQSIAEATGDLIGILHSDDFYTNPVVIRKVVETFLAQNCEAVYGDIEYVEKDNVEIVKRKWRSGEYTSGSFLFGWMPPHPSFFVKKDCYEKYGVFNEKLKTAADYELMLRMIHKYKINIAYLPETIVRMRLGGVSNRSFWNRINANLEDREAWKMNELKPYFFTLFLKPIRKISQFF